MRGVTKIRRALVCILVVLFGNSCSEQNNEMRQRIIVTDPNVESPTCCQTTYNLNISGASPTNGRFYSAALIRRDSLIKTGNPIFTPSGDYSNTPLSVSIDYRDKLAPGDYELRVLGFDSHNEIGNLAACAVTADVNVVSVPSFDVEQCFECDTIEVLYRTFIRCQILDFYGYFEGDNRTAAYSGQGFRSSQRMMLTYEFATRLWRVSAGSAFGITREWPYEAIVDTGNAPCVFLLRNGYTGEPDCEEQAVVGQNGNVQNLYILPIVGDTAHFAIHLIGYNPCVSGACAIDGRFDVYIYFKYVTGVPTPFVNVVGIHDQFPGHELYIRRLSGSDYFPRYQYDPYLWGKSPSDLCDMISVKESFELGWEEVN